MPVRTQICEAAIHPSALLAEVSRPENGAVNLFLGVTRNHHDQREVKDLDYHCYRPMAEQELQRVAESVCARHGIREFVALHRIGRVTIGELSLVVAVGAPHRAAALDCTRDFVDALKRDVPIWKRESFADGRAGWVEGVEIVE